MTSVDNAIFLMDDEVIDNISTKIKTTKKKKPKNNKIHKESISVIAKSLPIDIIKPIINNSVQKLSFAKFGTIWYPSSPYNSTIIVPATL
jgi:hypothetical protein